MKNKRQLNKAPKRSCFSIIFLSFGLVAPKHAAQDVIFIDAPWGGRGYKDLEVLDLCLNDAVGKKIYVGNIVRRLLVERMARMVVIKVPFNFSFRKFGDMLKDYEIEKYAIGGFFVLQVYFKDIDGGSKAVS